MAQGTLCLDQTTRLYNTRVTEEQATYHAHRIPPLSTAMVRRFPGGSSKIHGMYAQVVRAQGQELFNGTPYVKVGAGQECHDGDLSWLDSRGKEAI